MTEEDENHEDVAVQENESSRSLNADGTKKKKKKKKKAAAATTVDDDGDDDHHGTTKKKKKHKKVAKNGGEAAEESKSSKSLNAAKDHDDDEENHHHHTKKKKKKRTSSTTKKTTTVIDETGDDEGINVVETTVKQVDAKQQRGESEDLSNGTTSTDKSGLDDPFKIREGRDLVWKDVNVTLKAHGKDPEKKLLDSVWGEVPKRQVTAIMGPSGSGKTTLLNVLAGRARSNGKLLVESDVRLNNFSVDPTKIEVRNKIAFVAQDDSLQVTATPREAILFSARLRLPKNTTEPDLISLTDRMLSELGLQDCAETIVGGALIKGISGGERKRTSVGVELAARPALVFLDEPTSGLDSFNAVQLCHVLRKVAHAGASVLFTIHQPNSEIFMAFDSLILLNKGRVMYQGHVRDVPNYFEVRGHPIPPNYNPADWVMNVALGYPIEVLDASGYFPKDERDLGDAFEHQEEGKDALGLTLREEDEEVDDGGKVGVTTQTVILFNREVKNLVRNTHALKTRVAMTVMISLVIGFIFYDVAETDYTEFINVQSTFGALLMSLLANVFSTALPSLLAFPEERPVFLREYSTNHYSVLAYFISRLGMELLITASQVTTSSLITYFLVGFYAPYSIFWSGLYLMACASTAIGVMLGCTVENPEQAIEFLPAMFMPQILFSGFFVPPGLIPDWLSWIRHICPLTYGVGIVLTAEFNGRCNDLDPPNYCERVMDNAGVDPQDRYWYYFVLLALFFVFRIRGLMALKMKATKFY